MKRVVVPLAGGFEEIEAVAVIDILRRGGVDVTVAGVGGRRITGSHGITLESDCLIDDCRAGDVDAVVLPGGMPGTTNLGASEPVRRLAAAVSRAGGVTGAICAAPTVLDSLGLLKGRLATSHPNHEDGMTSCRYRAEDVVADEEVITSRGAGTAIPFALRLLEMLVGAQAAEDVAKRIVHR